MALPKLPGSGSTGGGGGITGGGGGGIGFQSPLWGLKPSGGASSAPKPPKLQLGEGPKFNSSRPFAGTGKGNINLLGTPPVYTDPLAPQPPKMFANTPVEGVFDVLGGISNILTAPSESIDSTWTDEAGSELGLKYRSLIEQGAVGEQDAKAQLRAEVMRRDSSVPRLYQSLFQPGIGGAAGGAIQALSVLDAPYRTVERAVVGLDPMDRLNSLSVATDDQLENNTELLRIRDEYNAGTLGADDTIDDLILAGFGTSNPRQNDIPFVAGLQNLFMTLALDPINWFTFGAGSLASLSVRATRKSAVVIVSGFSKEMATTVGEQVARAGARNTPDVVLKYAIESSDDAIRAAAEKSLQGLPPVQRWLIVDAPHVAAMGRRIDRALDPLTLFGKTGRASYRGVRAVLGKNAQNRAASEYAEGVIAAVGSDVVRKMRGIIRDELGDEGVDVFEEGFGRAGEQYAVQVGAKQSIVHGLKSQNLADAASDATEMARERLSGMGSEARRSIRAHAEQKALRLLPTRMGDEGAAQMLEAAKARAVQQLLRMPGTGLEAATRMAGRMSERLLVLLDLAHYGLVGKAFLAAKREAGAVLTGVREGGSTLDDSIIFLGPRQMTKADMPAFMKAVASGDADAVRDFIERWDDLYQVYNVEQADDALLKQISRTIDQLEQQLPGGVDDMAKLHPAMQSFFRDNADAGYRAGHRPADDLLARAVIDEDGRIIGLNPWLDFVDGQVASIPISRFKVGRDALFSTVSGATVMRDAKRRFVSQGARRFGLTEQQGLRLFADVQRAAEKRELPNARGMSPGEMYEVVLDMKLPKSVRERMNQREFAQLVIDAQQGSLRYVGLSQKFTGLAKSWAHSVTGGNPLGLIAEKIYPMTRFQLQAFFQEQEFFETPFLLLVRGYIPLDHMKKVWTKAGREEMREETAKTLAMMQDLQAQGLLIAGDMAEQSMLYLMGQSAVNRGLARNGLFARLGRKFPNVKGMKEYGVARSYEHESAKLMEKAIRDDISPKGWSTYVTWLQAQGRSRRPEYAATQFYYDAIARADPRSVYSRFAPDAFGPEHLGRRARVSTDLVKYVAVGEQGDDISWANFRRRVRDPEDDLLAEDVETGLREMGADEFYIERAMNRLTGPTGDEFWAGLKTSGVDDVQIAAWREYAEAEARAAQVHVDEWLSDQFAGAPRTLNHLGEYKGRTLFHTLEDTMTTRGLPLPDVADPALVRATDAAIARLPTWEMGFTEPWRATPNAAFTEYVDVSWLMRDPAIRGNALGKRNVRELAGEIEERGFDEPLQLTYYRGDNKVVLGEGNHRLEAANISGIERVPVRVVRYEGKAPAGMGVKVKGATPDKFGGVSGDLTPSDIGLRGSDIPVAVKNLSKAQRDRYDWNRARARREADPTRGMSQPVVASPVYRETVGSTGRGATPEQGRAIQAAYDRGARKLPTEPGVAPLEPGFIRAYHYTGTTDQLNSIRATGLDRSLAKGETYGEPNSIWFSTSKPSDSRNFVEVHLRPEELDVGGPWNARDVWDQKRIDDFNDRGGNFTVKADRVEPDRIVASGEDWHSEYRQLVAEGPKDVAEFKAQFGFALEGKWVDTSTGRAVANRLEDLEAFAEGLRLQREAMDAPDAIPGFGVPPSSFNPNVITKNGKVIGKLGHSTPAEWLEQVNNAFDPERLNTMVEWYPQVRRLVFALAKGDEEKATQMLLGFGLSQKSTSPQEGLRQVFMAIASMQREGKLPDDFGGLSADTLRRLFEEGAVTNEGMGQKLVDFVDTILGKTERSAGNRGPRGDWQPVAFDVHMKRDAGFLDQKMSARLKHAYDAKSVTFDKETGFTITLKNGEVHSIPAEQVGRDVPSDLEYDYGVEVYNDRARYANSVGFLDRNDWTAGQMQTIGWFKAKTMYGDVDGDPFDALFGQTREVFHEVVPAANAPFAEVFPTLGEFMDEDTLRLINTELNPYYDMTLEEVLGVTLVGRTRNSHGLWTEGPEAGTVVPNSITRVAGARRDAEAVARTLAYLKDQNGVPATRMAGPSVKTVKPGGDHVWALDYVPTGMGSKMDADALFRKLAQSDEFTRTNGGSVVQLDDGSWAVRIMWVDETSQASFIKKGSLSRKSFTTHTSQAAVQRAGGMTYEPQRAIVESLYAYADDPAEHLEWLRGNGYQAQAERLERVDKRRGRLATERAYRKHNAHGLDSYRRQRAFVDPEYRARSIVADTESDYATSIAGDSRLGVDVDRARVATRAGEPLFHRTSRGTLGATLLDERAGRQRIFLKKGGGDLDTLAHENAHVTAGRLDPSGRVMVLDAFNESVGRPGRVRSGAAVATPGPRVTVTSLRAKLGDAEVERLARDHPERFTQASTGSKDAKITKAAVKFPDGTRGDYYSDPGVAATVSPVAVRSGGPARAAKTEWDDDVEEWFANQWVEWVRTGTAPRREMEPLFAFASESITKTTRRGELQPEMEAALDAIGARKPEVAHGFNVDESNLLDLMLSQANRSARNANDLVHFRTERSFMERSLNHPFFGLYPLSYMWGKILPELVEFLAFRPFGMKAPGGALNIVNKMYQQVMLQQAYDPELREYLADNEPALRAMAMLVPGLPWELPVNTPLYIRRIVEAVATQQERVLQGKKNPDGTPAEVDLGKIDYGNVFTDVSGYSLNPIKGVFDVADTVTGTATMLGAAAGGALTSGGPDPRTQEGPRLTTEQPAQVEPVRPVQGQPQAPQGTPVTPTNPLEGSLQKAAADLAQQLGSP